MAVGLLVRTRQGLIAGRRQGRVCVWRGIRYARPPVGALRFAPPLPPLPNADVEQADHFGPASMQAGLSLAGGKESPGRFEEDCLRLNIWSQAADEERRPVMLWIHGGAFLIGSANLFDGADLAASGEIVVVTINYRLGIFGFTDFGSVLADPRATANNGLRDMIAALQWVRDNIAGFGGDPDRVTIAGESAGSIAVALLMQSSAARGLFGGAIMQSGAPPVIHDRRVGRMLAQTLLDALGTPPGAFSLEALQALPPERLLAAQAEAQKRLRGGVISGPIFDGDLLPADAQASASSPASPVPLLAGFTNDEIRLFELLPGRLLLRRREQMAELIHDRLSDHAKAVLGCYPDTRRGNRALASDLYMAMPTLHFAERHCRVAPTWLYRFDMRHPLLGASHGLDLLYLWEFNGAIAALIRGAPNLGPWRRLAGRMRRHWISFVLNGRPGHDWKAYDTDRRSTMLFDWSDSMLDDPQSTRRAAWACQDLATGAATSF